MSFISEIKINIYFVKNIIKKKQQQKTTTTTTTKQLYIFMDQLLLAMLNVTTKFLLFYSLNLTTKHDYNMVLGPKAFSL